MRALGNVALRGLYSFADSATESLFYAFDQLGSLSGLTRTIKHSAATKKMFKHTGQMIITDLLPMICAHAFYNLIWNSVFPDDSATDDAHSSIGYSIAAPMIMLGVTVGLNYLCTARQNQLSTKRSNYRVQLPLLALGVATGTAPYYFQTRLMIRSSILTLQHHDAFHLPNRRKRSGKHAHRQHDSRHEICQRADCKPMRYAKGEVRAYMTYILLSLLVTLVPMLMQSNPILSAIGSFVAFMLSAQLYGELFLEYYLADNQMCDRHRMVYFQEHPELSLSLGMMHAFSCMLLGYALNHWLNIPNGSLDFSLKAVTSLIFLGIPYHMPKLPAAKLKSNRWPTPPTLLRSGVAAGMDLTTAGFKKAMKVFVKQQSPEQWDIQGLYDDIRRFMQNRHIKKLRLTLTPSIIHDLESFTKDPVLKDYLTQIRTTAHACVIDIKQAKDSYITAAVLAMPIDAGSLIVAQKFHVPKSIASLIIKCLNSPRFMELVDQCDRYLTDLGPQPRFTVRQAAASTTATSSRAAPRRLQQSFSLRDREHKTTEEQPPARRRLRLNTGQVRSSDTSRAARQPGPRNEVAKPIALRTATDAAPDIAAAINTAHTTPLLYSRGQPVPAAERSLLDFMVVDYIGDDGNVQAAPLDTPSPRR